MSELRWNPLLGEWVMTATHRQDRTFLPPPDYCPLCPTRAGGFPTEIPAPDFEVVVFENRFPSLRNPPDVPALEPDEFFQVAPNLGVCEVIVYTPEHAATLAQASVERIERLVYVWRHRFAELGQMDHSRYVFIFENKGEVIGVTLSHPHGQVYAYPFIPPRIERELAQCKEYQQNTGKCLLCETVSRERAGGARMLGENEHFAAYVPFFARWPYEAHVVAKRHLQALTDLNPGEMRGLARILKSLLAAYDRLFDFSFPYIMALHQRPVDGGDYGFYHLHIEFFPPMRTAQRIKYLAGSETGAGAFINDTLPEATAAQLRGHWQPV